MTQFVEYFITVTPHDGVAPHPLYFGTTSLQTGPADDPADTFFEDRLEDPGNFEQHLWSTGTTRGQSSVAVGDIIIVRLSSDAASDDEDPNDWLGWRWKGAPLVIRRWDGVGLLSDAEVVLVASCQRITADEETYVLQIHDRLSDLDEPLLSEKYLGTSIGPGLGIEGNDDLKGDAKQRCWGGPNYSVPIQWANSYDNIGQVSSGEVHAIELLSGGNALSNLGDYPSLATLRALAPLAVGTYATCNFLAIFLAGVSPQSQLEFTANVTEGATAADRTMGQIWKRMMEHYDPANEIDETSVMALDAANSAVCAVFVSGDETALSAMSRLLGSDFGFVLSTADDQFQVGRLELPDLVAPVVLLTEDEFSDVSYEASNDTDGGDSAGRVLVRYAEVNTVMTGTQLAGVLTTAQKAFFEKQWRTSVAESASVLALDPQAPEIVVESCFVSEADADAAAARGLAIYSEARTFVRLTIADMSEIVGVVCNSVIALTLNDLNFVDEKRFRVLSRTVELDDETATLVGWA